MWNADDLELIKEASTLSHARSSSKKFRELLPLLIARVFSHKMKEKFREKCYTI